MDDRARAASVKVGIFVVSAMILLAVGSLWIAGSAVFGVRKVPYTVLLKDSSGLLEGGRVRVAGVPVGRIQSINLRPTDPWPVEMRIAIRPDIVRADATAVVANEGLMGQKFLQIDAGSAESPVLEVGGVIEGQATMSLEQLMARVDAFSTHVIDLTDQAKQMLAQVSDQLHPILTRAQDFLSPENAENLRQTFATLRSTVDEVGPRLSSLTARLDSVSGRLDSGLERLPEMTTKVEGLVEDLRTALGPDGSRLAGVLDSAEQGLISAEEALAILTANKAQIDATFLDLRDTMANLKDFSQQVKERPHSLVRVDGPSNRKPGQGAKKGKP